MKVINENGQEIEFNHIKYKCPTCSGEFNEPAKQFTGGCNEQTVKCCPWCGERMKGL